MITGDVSVFLGRNDSGLLITGDVSDFFGRDGDGLIITGDVVFGSDLLIRNEEIVVWVFFIIEDDSVLLKLFKLNDNFDKSWLGGIADEFDEDKRGSSGIWIGNDFRVGIISVFTRNIGLDE